MTRIDRIYANQEINSRIIDHSTHEIPFSDHRLVTTSWWYEITNTVTKRTPKLLVTTLTNEDFTYGIHLLLNEIERGIINLLEFKSKARKLGIKVDRAKTNALKAEESNKVSESQEKLTEQSEDPQSKETTQIIEGTE
ncbi:hypothetical protein CONCODRAFT_7987 [Conidiobolus coronatus NRRL 28638]|uniref:Uncharacterized protein n=1 Tax=Conidiobolus coronatus (strain ATCC 28846 / CBS 209.66 / NRRL 28638) TaxID=796925 RepID=A0A137P3V2_CONC2|nr:hypothetical protein CONCODRAFT_7987 [Conidiobolus coronatus NRRL 28638]|eukprot:KXN69574.1 hypothetical protein CONCODRAFT_7987 [Conidiobolus coronatus NRRL 28638]